MTRLTRSNYFGPVEVTEAHLHGMGIWRENGVLVTHFSEVEINGGLYRKGEELPPIRLGDKVIVYEGTKASSYKRDKRRWQRECEPPSFKALSRVAVIDGRIGPVLPTACESYRLGHGIVPCWHRGPTAPAIRPRLIMRAV